MFQLIYSHIQKETLYEHVKIDSITNTTIVFKKKELILKRITLIRLKYSYQ
jgi:hypothetical protein